MDNARVAFPSFLTRGKFRPVATLNRHGKLCSQNLLISQMTLSLVFVNQQGRAKLNVGENCVNSQGRYVRTRRGQRGARRNCIVYRASVATENRDPNPALPVKLCSSKRRYKPRGIVWSISTSPRSADKQDTVTSGGRASIAARVNRKATGFRIPPLAGRGTFRLPYSLTLSILLHYSDRSTSEVVGSSKQLLATRSPSFSNETKLSESRD